MEARRQYSSERKLLDRFFLVVGNIGLDFREMVVGIGERVIHIGRTKVRVMPHNFCNGHSLTRKLPDQRNANPRPGNNRASATYSGSLVNITVVNLAHRMPF